MEIICDVHSSPSHYTFIDAEKFRLFICYHSQPTINIIGTLYSPGKINRISCIQ